MDIMKEKRLHYISAESKKLIPASKAWSRSRKDWHNVFCSPKVMVPEDSKYINTYIRVINIIIIIIINESQPKQSLETVRSGARLKRGTTPPPILSKKNGIWREHYTLLSKKQPTAFASVVGFGIIR